jgi:hypothetical protein
MSELGRLMFSQNLVLRGRLDEAGWRSFLEECVSDLELTPVGDETVWSYPTADGKGGEGLTICRPMAESFMVVDVWPAHNGAYLHISSCREFDIDGIVAVAAGFSLDMHHAGKTEVLEL